jgi:hypothetical protein
LVVSERGLLAETKNCEVTCISFLDMPNFYHSALRIRFLISSKQAGNHAEF